LAIVSTIADDKKSHPGGHLDLNEATTQKFGRQRTGTAFRSTAEKRQRAYILLISMAVAGLAIALSVYGWDYYTLDQLHRPFSPKHGNLKPSGIVGLRLGILGLALFFLVYLYPLRKHWAAMGRIGKTKNWFDFHVLLGLSAPVAITFHCAFKTHGFAGMAYWTMIALVGSGIIGRYFYAQIPRNIGAAEMSLKEMQDFMDTLLDALKLQTVLRQSEFDALFSLPDGRAVQSMPMYRALLLMIAWDFARPFRVWSLRRHGIKAAGRRPLLCGILRTKRSELEQAIALVSKQASLSKRILFLSKTHRIFHLWHVVHRPFSISFAVFVVIHVAVVTWFGYF
jgi:hypothetical protein